MGQDVFLQMGKLAFDAIEPRCVGGGELEVDVVLFGPAQDVLCLVGREVVQHHPEAPGVFAAHGFEKREELPSAFSALEMPPNLSGAHIVCGQQMPDAVPARVGCSKTLGMPTQLPRTPGVRTQFQRAELVDADHLLAAFFRRVVERFDGVFFTSKSGSDDCFHVLVRWSEI